MAMFYQQNINEHTRLGIWHITETESFFEAEVPQKSDVHHPHKRLQHLAGRLLLKRLFADFPLHEIEIADTRKPFLPDEQYHFSISHCGNFAAAIASSKYRVGLDLELAKAKIIGMKNKFLSAEEEAGFGFMTKHHYNLVWCKKEAMFKWYGLGQVDFKKDMFVGGFGFSDDHGVTKCQFKKNEIIPLDLHWRVFGELALAYVLTD